MRWPIFGSPATPAAAQYARSPLTGPKTPWQRARYCVVDLELSGLNPREHEIISFAAVPIDAGRLVVGGAVYGVCRPTQPLHEASIQPLLTAMTGRVIVAHVGWVEHAFLSRALRRQGVRFRGPILDTFELGRLLARQRREEHSRRTLDELAQYLRLPIYRRHHALGDALTTAQVFVALATHLDELASESVQSLAHAKERAHLLQL
jgi:DNA polymerase-3 subunit epsilon